MEPSANEHVQNAGKKTVMPTDVFQALEDTEFAFLREPLEAEFASAYLPSTTNLPLPTLLTATSCAHSVSYLQHSKRGTRSQDNLRLLPVQKKKPATRILLANPNVEFNQIQSAKRSNYRQKAAAAKRSVGTPNDADTSTLTEGTPSKKPRVEGEIGRASCRERV